MVGSSMGSAPTSRSSAGEPGRLALGARDQHALAEQRLRVEPAQVLAQAARRRPRWSARASRGRPRAAFSAMSPTVPTTVRCVGSEAHDTTAAGVSGARPCSTQALHQAVELAQAHEEDERLGGGRELGPVVGALVLLYRLGGRHVGHAAREVAMGERDARVGRGGHGRGHTRHDLEGDAARSTSASASSEPRPNR